MRPTDIKLKTPREKTPGPIYLVNLTNTGKNLDYSKIFKDKKTFSTEKRFKTYQSLANRTCNNVGPGSYNHDKLSFINNSLKKSTVKYLPTKKNYESSKKNFYMVGNLLVCDDSFLIKKQKKTKKNYFKSKDSKKVLTSSLNFSPKKH